MRRFLGNIISVICSFIRFVWLKLFHFNKLKFYPVERFSPNVVVEINKSGELYLGNKVRVHSGSKLKIRNNAKMIIGSGVKVNYNCIFVARERIDIGDGTEFGPNVLVYDHDHDYRKGLIDGGFISEPISIGRNCWIGANTIILRGTSIGDNVVIAAGSTVKGDIPSNSIFVQKREAKVSQWILK